MTHPECPWCGAHPPKDAKFCHSCGKCLLRTPFSIRRALALGVAVVLLVALIFPLHRALVGTSPTTSFQQPAAPQAVLPQTDDPEILALRKKVETDSDNVGAWLALGQGYLQKAKAGVVPEREAVLETIEAYGRALELEPKNLQALLAMADLSFDQQAFSKSKEFYERYLEQKPQDLDVQARYASSLTFLGRAEDAITILEKVVKADPSHFQARAFLSISNAQLGKRAEAIRIGKSALPLAPHEEARARFQGFLDSLASSSSEGSPPGIEQVVAASPIAGAHFVRSEHNGRTLRLVFRDFPMAGMPPVAKEKFLNPLQNIVNSSTDVDAVVFVDLASGNAMETLVKSPNTK